jgi:ubiquinone/menaquinone biosynthesis C-methylase UbiE
VHTPVDLNKNLTALEFGCGTGLVSFEFYSRLKEIMLIDNSKEMIAVLSDKIKRCKIDNMYPVFVQPEDFTNLNKIFDLIYMQLVLHHINDYKTVLSELYTKLSENGHICIADLDKEDGSFHEDKTLDVHYGFDRDDLKVVLNKIGYKDINFKTVYYYKSSNNDMKYPVFLLTAKK